MTGLIRAEGLKLFKRLPFWVMGLLLVFFVGVSALVLVVLPRVAPDAFGEIPFIPGDQAITLGLQTAIGQTWFPAILAAVMVGGEVGSAIWPSDLAREARRWMHVLAKLVVLTAAATLAIATSAVVWIVLVAISADTFSWPAMGEWLSLAWKAVVVEGTWVALGIGAVGLFRSIGPAIGAVLGLNLGDGFLSLWGPWANISPSANQTAMLGEMADLGAGFGTSADIPMARATLVVVAWAVAATIVAVAGLMLRDP